MPTPPSLRLPVLFAATSLAFAVSACSEGEADPAANGPPPIPAHVLEVVARDVPRVRAAVGSLESPEMTTVASEIAGTIVAADAFELLDSSV